MSRLMSVAMTTDAVIERRKTVTRRKGWWLDKNGRSLLHVGDTLTLCRKVQGRKPGEPIERLAEVEVVSVLREPLYLCIIDWEFEGPREGFLDVTAQEFMRRYFTDAQGITASDLVTRIEWRYLDEPCDRCAQPVADSALCGICATEAEAECWRCKGSREIPIGPGLVPWESEYDPCPECEATE